MSRKLTYSKLYVYNLQVGDNNPFVVPHTIKGDITYCMWSLASQVNGSLMKRDNTTMECNGTMKTNDIVLGKYDCTNKIKLKRLIA
jgi:hypothetical protein